MKLKINWIDISGIRSFGLNQKFLFSDNTLYSVLGINKDDGGSNASGKTSFIISMPLLIFGPEAVKGITTAELKNRYMSIQSRVSGSLMINDVELLIDRIIGGKLKIKHGDNDWEDGKVTDVQSRIDDILGISMEQFLTLSYKGQGEYGGFLLMTDSKKKDFLSSFFDVSWVDESYKKAKSDLIDKQNLLNSTKGKLDSFKAIFLSVSAKADEARLKNEYYNSEEFISKITELSDRIENNTKTCYRVELEIQNLDISEHDEYIKWNSLANEVRSSLKTSQESFLNEKSKVDIKNLEISNNIKALEDILKSPIVVPDELRARLTAIQKAISNASEMKKSLNTMLVSLSTTENSIKNKKEMLKSKEQDLSIIKDSICVTCGQDIHDDTNVRLKEKIKLQCEKIITEINTLEVSASSVKEKISKVNVTDKDMEILSTEEYKAKSKIDEFVRANNREDLRLKILSLQGEVKSNGLSVEIIKKQTEKLQSQIDDYEYKISVYKKQCENDLKSQLTGLQTSIKLSKLEQKSLDNEKRTSEEKILELEKTLSEVSDTILENEQALESIAKDIDIIEKCLEVLSRNGFVGYIFDSILEDLNSEINSNLKNIPNARKFSLQFSPDRVSKTTDSTSKSIAYQIYCGNKEVSFNSLSGGEKLSVIISVDEALDTVLSRRLGASIGWKILDEQFGWIDENSKESILEFLRSKTQDRSYIIVDHASEFNASIDNQIVIVKENEIATFKSSC